MKLDREQDLNVLYQVCVFLADRKTKMAAPTSDWLTFLTSAIDVSIYFFLVDASIPETF